MWAAAKGAEHGNKRGTRRHNCHMSKMGKRTTQKPIRAKEKGEETEQNTKNSNHTPREKLRTKECNDVNHETHGHNKGKKCVNTIGGQHAGVQKDKPAKRTTTTKKAAPPQTNERTTRVNRTLNRLAPQLTEKIANVFTAGHEDAYMRVLELRCTSLERKRRETEE